MILKPEHNGLNTGKKNSNNNKMKTTLSFINFNHLSEDILLEILEHRNSKEIREQMRNTEIISKDEHLNFCKNLHSNHKLLYYAVFNDNKLIGVIDGVILDEVSRTFMPGCYFFDESSIVRTHACIAASYIWNKKNLLHSKVIVKKNNTKALMFNILKFGYKIDGEDNEYYHLSTNLNENKDFVKKRFKKINELYNLIYEL